MLMISRRVLCILFPTDSQCVVFATLQGGCERTASKAGDDNCPVSYDETPRTAVFTAHIFWWVSFIIACPCKFPIGWSIRLAGMSFITFKSCWQFLFWELSIPVPYRGTKRLHTTSHFSCYYRLFQLCSVKGRVESLRMNRLLFFPNSIPLQNNFKRTS